MSKSFTGGLFVLPMTLICLSFDPSSATTCRSCGKAADNGGFKFGTKWTSFYHLLNFEIAEDIQLHHRGLRAGVDGICDRAGFARFMFSTMVGSHQLVVGINRLSASVRDAYNAHRPCSFHMPETDCKISPASFRFCQIPSREKRSGRRVVPPLLFLLSVGLGTRLYISLFRNNDASMSRLLQQCQLPNGTVVCVHQRFQ
jgi:hypothetical protein